MRWCLLLLFWNGAIIFLIIVFILGSVICGSTESDQFSLLLHVLLRRWELWTMMLLCRDNRLRSLQAKLWQSWCCLRCCSSSGIDITVVLFIIVLVLACIGILRLLLLLCSSLSNKLNASNIVYTRLLLSSMVIIVITIILFVIVLEVTCELLFL